MNSLLSGFNGILAILAILGLLQFLYFIFSGGIPGTRFYYARRLRDPDGMVRQETIRQLFEKGASFAKDLLIEALKASDVSTRALAIEALGRIDDSDVVAPLLPHLHDPSMNIQIKTIEALTRHADPSVNKAMLAVLPKADHRVQLAALRYFRDHPDADVVPAACKLVLSPDEHLNHMAMTVLSPFKTEAITTLGTLIPDSDDHAPKAIRAMLDLDRAESVEPLKRAFDRTVNVSNLRELLQVLVRLGAPGTVEFLIPYTSDPGFALRDLTIDALASLPETASLNHLIRLQADPDRRVRQRAAKNLAKVAGDCPLEQTLPLLCANLVSPDVPVARLAAQTLGEVGGLKGLATVMRTMWGDEAPVIQEFIEGLTGTPLSRMVKFDEVILAIDRISGDQRPTENALRAIGYLTSLVVVLHGEQVRALRVDAQTTDLMVRGRRTMYPLHFEHLHPLAQTLLEFVVSKAEGDRWRTTAAV